MKTVIYPGSFDPITNGHIDIIERAVVLFDKVVISIVKDVGKGDPLFSVDERIRLVSDSIKHFDNVIVDSFDGLMVNHASKYNAVAAIRGLRALSDFEFEFKMALMNRSINNDIRTVFLMSHEKYMHLSSSMIKEVASLGGPICNYVPEFVANALEKKYNNEKN